jgi:hypothetical protein
MVTAHPIKSYNTLMQSCQQAKVSQNTDLILYDYHLNLAYRISVWKTQKM